MQADVAAVRADHPSQQDLPPPRHLPLGAQPRETIPAIGTRHLIHHALRVTLSPLIYNVKQLQDACRDMQDSIYFFRRSHPGAGEEAYDTEGTATPTACWSSVSSTRLT
jgi:hypothetical protein